jgi:hypothetical protein
MSQREGEGMKRLIVNDEEKMFDKIDTLAQCYKTF